MTSSSTLVSEWQRAAAALGLEIVTPYVASLPSGKRVEAEVLVKSFGGENGLLVVDAVEQVAALGDEICDAGYGLLGFRDEDEDEPFELEAFKDLLCEMNWHGKGPEPEWMGAYRRSTEYRVYLVVDPELIRWARSDDPKGVWVVTPPDGQLPKHAPAGAIAFRTVPGESTETLVLRAVREINATLGVEAQDPAWSHINVLGASLTPAIEDAALEMDIQDTSDTRHGFVLTRRYGW